MTKIHKLRRTRQERQRAIITLLSDFGSNGHFSAEVKGVILGINPAAVIVDITHSIAPQNVDEAAWVLFRAAAAFPEGTIHVAVVDPGVGSGRAILAVQTAGQIFLSPDNGLLKYVFDGNPDAEVFRVDVNRVKRPGASDTFHGRDVFAPVAACLSLGEPIESLGMRTVEFDKGRIARPVVRETEALGEVIYIDPFGNAVSNVDSASLGGRWDQVRLKDGRMARRVRVFADGKPGELVSNPGSAGMIEIAVTGGNAHASGIRVGDPIKVIADSKRKN